MEMVKKPLGNGKRLWLPLTLAFVLGWLAFSPAALAVPDGGYTHPEVLIQPQELKALLDRKDPNIRVVDVRHRTMYLMGHIPGAVQLWRYETKERHSLSGPMAPRAKLEKVLGNLGITWESTIVMYSDRFDQARLWWILAYYGFPLNRLKILDGGISGWKAKGYPTQVFPPSVKKTAFAFSANPGRDYLAADLAQIKAALSDPKKVLVDDRAKKQYLGEEAMAGARPGHIPGAVWVEWSEVVVPEGPYKGFWKPAAKIRKIYADKGVTPDKEVYLYCHVGVTSAHSLLGLYLIGFPLEKLRNYEGSSLEWSRAGEPLETGAK